MVSMETKPGNPQKNSDWSNSSSYINETSLAGQMLDFVDPSLSGVVTESISE